MTAALILEPLERTHTRQLAVVRPEPKLITLAREGDAAAMRDLLDLTSDNVYGYAYNAVRSSREAQQITNNVLQRLPRLLRRQRWDTLEAFSSQVMSIARAEVGVYNRRQARTDSRRDVRAWTRHAVLAATSVATIASACILAF